ncbi:MAG: ATP-binding protein, partial [Actinomycetota bacterium]
MDISSTGSSDYGPEGAHAGHVLTGGNRAPAQARELVVAACDGMAPTQVDIAKLLVTELVSNAVIHGAGQVALRISIHDHLMRVDVSDGDPRPPRLSDAASGPEQQGGRGLHMVAAFASAW